MKIALIVDNTSKYLVDMFKLSYHLVLAREVLNSAEYANYWYTRHSRGDFIMMDNGAAEGGTLKPRELLTAAFLCGADEVILPDVLRSKDATLSLYKEAIEHFPVRMSCVAPQGRTHDEWFDCLAQMLLLSDFRTIGIPKHCETFAGGRADILKRLIHMRYHERYDIHLLGVWEDPIREVKYYSHQFPWVRGLDTAAPIAYAQQNRMLQTGVPNQHISHVWEREHNKMLVSANVATLLSQAGYTHDPSQSF